MDVAFDPLRFDPLRGENRTRPLSMQPPGCYYSRSEEQLVFSPIICVESEQLCPDWFDRTYGMCSKELTCHCECSFLSLAVLALVVIFFSQDYLEDPEYWCRLRKLLYDMLGIKP